jgi:hypothetical protein
MDSLSFDSLDQLCCRHAYRLDYPANARVQLVWSDDETDFVLNSIAVIFVFELDDLPEPRERGGCSRVVPC